MQELCSTLILAGGRSTRMGKDKAKLILGGRSVLESILRTALEVSENAVVMRAPGQDLPWLPEALLEKVRIGHDRVEGQGPLQGITDALHLLPENSERVYVLTCDLPYLNREWLLKLSASLTEEWDAVCTLHEDIANPLLALYRVPVLKRAPLLLESGQRRPKALWEGWSVRRLPAQSEDMFHVRDMNTPDDYDLAKKHFNKIYD